MLSFYNFSSALPEVKLFPLKESSEQADDLKLPKKDVEPNPFILIFSLSEDLCLLFKTALEIWNYDAAEAKSVEQCVAVAEHRCPDLVLMDTYLDISESLSEMQRLRADCVWLEKVPFILLSGHIQENVRRTAMDAGADDFFIKPVNFELLESALKSRLIDANRIDSLGGFP